MEPVSTIISSHRTSRLLRAALVLIVGLLSTAVLLIAPVRATAVPVTSQVGCGAGVLVLGYSDALDKTTFEGTDVGGLSALVHDPERDVYYALVDNEGSTAARFYTLTIPITDAGLGVPAIQSVTVLTRADGTPFTGDDLDAEGMTLTPDGELLISSETEPSIYHFTLDGQLLATLPVPERFLVAPAGGAEANRSFESLALTPDGQHLFTATEGPLADDGYGDNGAARIRILRYDRQPDGSFQPAAESLYLTAPGGYVVDVVAVGPDELLVLERGFDLFTMFSARVFRVFVGDAADVSDVPSLAETSVTQAVSALLADLGRCPAGPGASEPAPMDNFEGLALGPRLPGGGQLLLVVSDDNFDDGQTTRIIAFTVSIDRGEQPTPEPPQRRSCHGE